MLVFTEDNIRGICSVSTDMSFSEVENYVAEQKEPILFVKKKDEILGYIRAHDIMDEIEEMDIQEIEMERRFWLSQL
ncbi:hypothetical protein, partial [Acinetobacter baumannii]|uniref:hypothetical protein n=1 Tax=Acinetobacter baumannii TaxID=470 RepID=UPI00129DE749